MPVLDIVIVLASAPWTELEQIVKILFDVLKPKEQRQLQSLSQTLPAFSLAKVSAITIPVFGQQNFGNSIKL
jgi:hypothetical protein